MAGRQRPADTEAEPQSPLVVMDFERCTRLMCCALAEHYDHETCRDVPLSRLYGFGKPTNVSEITYKLTTDIILHYFKDQQLFTW